MANLSITSIKLNENVKIATIQAGEALAEYDVVYLLTGKYYKADATSVVKAVAAYIVLDAADADGWVAALPLSTTTTITLVGPTLLVTTQYVLSATGGKIAPRSDLVTGNFVTEIFTGATAAIANVDLEVTGIPVPA